MNRYIALDAFRGFTIALMILVITPGSWSYVYPPLLHADWHGWTPTDLVFPFFMFIIGSAMFFSFKKQNFQFSSSAFRKILIRSVVIFLIGVALNAFPTYETFSELRMMSVLGRIGLAYGIAAVLVLTLSRQYLLLLSGIILIGYWLVLWGLGGSAPYSLEGNLVRSVDLALLGEGHMWSGKGIAFDPEGLLSTLPSLVSIFIGFEATRMLLSSDSKDSAIRTLLTWALGALVLGYLWNFVFPINKYLWTSSYVLVTSAVALAVLAFFIWLVDIKKQNAVVEPLLIYGKNALFIYIFAAIWTDCYKLIQLPLSSGEYVDSRAWLFEAMTALFSHLNASLFFAVVHVMLFWLVCWFLSKKNIVIKI